MLESVYSWRVWDELKAGKKVYAVVIDGNRPEVVSLSSWSVSGVFRLMQEHPSALYYEPEEVD